MARATYRMHSVSLSEPETVLDLVPVPGPRRIARLGYGHGSPQIRYVTRPELEIEIDPWEELAELEGMPPQTSELTDPARRFFATIPEDVRQAVLDTARSEAAGGIMPLTAWDIEGAFSLTSEDWFAAPPVPTAEVLREEFERPEPPAPIVMRYGGCPESPEAPLEMPRPGYTPYTTDLSTMGLRRFRNP